MAELFQENGRLYLRHEVATKPGSRESVSSTDASANGGALSQFLFDSGNLLNDLAASQVTFEIGKTRVPPYNHPNPCELNYKILKI
jgi:hypothetical protein